MAWLSSSSEYELPLSHSIVSEFVTDAVSASVVAFGALPSVVAGSFVLACMVAGLEVRVSLSWHLMLGAIICKPQQTVSQILSD